jgi:AsmA family
MTRKGKAWRAVAGAVLLLAVLVAAVPHFPADRFRPRIQDSLERALGRKVEMGEVRFSLLTGPAFSVERVVIHDHPTIGIEPLAYVNLLTARLSLWSLLRGHVEFSSVVLDDASINLVKGDSARWNFESLLNRNFLTAFPAVHILGRLNFKFGDTKSVFYVTNADLDVTPPAGRSGQWKVSFTGEPARTDRPARGFGSLEAKGRWNGERLDLDLRVDQNAVGEIIALVRGQHVGIHGLVSSRLHLAGPLDNLRITGNLMLQDIHRWDQMPTHGNEWPLNVAGRLNLLAQTIEIESHSASGQTPPIGVRFRASDYLSQPHWGVSVNWNQFPLEPLIELARHMGAEIPPKLKVAGTLDGAIGYAGQGSLQGELGFHDTVVTIPDSAPMRFEAARMLFDRGHLHLTPAVVRTTQDDQAQIEADYTFDTQDFALTISTGSMDVASLRAQVALAAVPWMEQVQSGHWKGQLRYTWRPPNVEDEEETGWTGKIELEDAQLPLPGLADPLRIEAANAQIVGPSVVLDHMRARVGEIEAQGEYRYEPGAARPHRLKVVFAELDAAELERVLMPALARRGGLIARAFRRVPVPDWLARQHIDGTVQIAALTIGDTRFEHVRGRLLWDALKVELTGIQARLENGSVTGALAVNLRGARPSYRLVSRLRAMDCRSGKVDTETVLETAGTGAELLENLHAEGTFTGRALELASLPLLKSVSGSYKFVWARKAPRLLLTDLQLATGTEVFTGRGATQDDGRLLVQLSSGSREMRVSGSLAQLHVDETPRVQ